MATQNLRPKTYLDREEVQRLKKLADASGQGVWYTDARGPARGAGALLLRTTPGAEPRWYWRGLNAEGKRVVVPLGVYSDDTLKGLTIKDARDRAGEVSREQRREPSPDAPSPQRHVPQHARRRRMTLQQLMDIYSGELERHKKARSAQDVRRLIKIHLTRNFPRLAQKPAALITPDDVADLVRSVHKRGLNRTAGKIRSFVHAAFAAALNVGHDASISEDYKAAGVTFNPAALTRLPGAGIRPRRQFLSPNQLGDLLLKLETREGMGADLLRLLIWLGGQRLQMLLRATVSDLRLQEDGGVLTLWDPKGRRKEPRKHLLPLFGSPLDILKRLAVSSARMKTSLLFTTNGETAFREEKVTELFRELVRPVDEDKEDKEDKEDEKDPKPSEEHALQLRDLRRTVETELATLRVPRESRALLLSHGLSGVQVLHYDCHDVEPEVREALQVWHRRLAELECEARVRAEQAPNVVPIAKARGRKSVTKKRAVEQATERLLTLAGLARSLSMGKTTVKEMLARGELPPGIDIGGAQRWKWDEVLAWIQKRSATPAVVRAVA